MKKLLLLIGVFIAGVNVAFGQLYITVDDITEFLDDPSHNRIEELLANEIEAYFDKNGIQNSVNGLHWGLHFSKSNNSCNNKRGKVDISVKVLLNNTTSVNLDLVSLVEPIKGDFHIAGKVNVEGKVKLHPHVDNGSWGCNEIAEASAEGDVDINIEADIALRTKFDYVFTPANISNSGSPEIKIIPQGWLDVKLTRFDNQVDLDVNIDSKIAHVIVNAISGIFGNFILAAAFDEAEKWAEEEGERIIDTHVKDAFSLYATTGYRHNLTDHLGGEKRIILPDVNNIQQVLSKVLSKAGAFPFLCGEAKNDPGKALAEALYGDGSLVQTERACGKGVVTAVASTTLF